MTLVLSQSISNGIIQGSIENDVLISQPAADIYVTCEPQNTFATRTSYCLKIRETAQSALRYPQETYTEGLSTNHLSLSDKNGNNGSSENSENNKSEDKQSDSDDSSENDVMMLGGDAGEDEDEFDAGDFL